MSNVEETSVSSVGAGPRDPEELEATASAETAEISAQTSLGAVHLTVSDLERSVRYYRGSVGLRCWSRGVDGQVLG